MASKQLKWQTKHEEGYLEDTDRDDVFGGKIKRSVTTGYYFQTHTKEYTEEFHNLLLEAEGDRVHNVEVVE